MCKKPYYKSIAIGYVDHPLASWIYQEPHIWKLVARAQGIGS